MITMIQSVNMRRGGIILSAVALCLLVVGIICAWLTPCVGYEANIYLATPIMFWIGLVACYATGIILVTQAQLRQDHILLSHLGYLLMIFASLSLMSLMVIRGYGLLNIGGDTGTHLGALNTILDTGNLPSVKYPSVYSLPLFFHIFTGISLKNTLCFIPIFILSLFTLSVYLISKITIKNEIGVTITTIISLLLPVGSCTLIGSSPLIYVGMTIANIGLLPIFIYCLLRLFSETEKMFIPLYVISVSIIFYHPIVSLICIIMLVICLIMFNICSIRTYKERQKVFLQLIILITSELCLFFLWTWRFIDSLIIDGIFSIFNVLDVDSRGVGDMVSTFTTATDYGFSFDSLFRSLGINIIIYGMFIVAYILFMCHHRDNKYYLNLKLLFIFSIGVMGLMTISLVGNFDGGYLRYKQLIYIISLISWGFVLSFIILKCNKLFKIKATTMIICVCIILLVICILSVISFHPSPYTCSTGYQTTKTTYVGAETLLPCLDIDKQSVGYWFSAPFRHIVAIYGSRHVMGSYTYGDYHLISTPEYYVGYSKKLSPHFGYNSSIKSLNEIYSLGTSVFLTEKDKLFSQDSMYPEVLRSIWIPSDFEHLKYDNGLLSVYNNGGFWMYIVM